MDEKPDLLRLSARRALGVVAALYGLNFDPSMAAPMIRPCRKPFQFGLAKLMLAVVPLAMYFGLLHWAHKHEAHMREAIRWAESFGESGDVWDGGKFFQDSKLSLNLAGTNVTDRDLLVLEDQTDLARLNLANTAITDDGLRLLYHARELEMLNVTGTRVTPAGVRALREALPAAVVRR